MEDMQSEETHRIRGRKMADRVNVEHVINTQRVQRENQYPNNDRQIPFVAEVIFGTVGCV